jgi:RHH-type proline utilization regulon transcriptional repressor/proline dehydrogenase/delta 1-pyrroline-5-carboxylate dehydrogenase
MDKKLSKLLEEVSSSRFIAQAETVAFLQKNLEKSRADINYLEIKETASRYVYAIRENLSGFGIEAFFQHYGLDTSEGVALMLLAESLLRIPDSATANDLIHDKLKNINWKSDSEASTSALMKASNFGLKFAGKLFSHENVITKLADPVVRASVKKSVRVLGNHFVMGETIEDALNNSKDYNKAGYTFSYDMLGEGARSEEQAAAYLEKYLHAIDAISSKINVSDTLYKRPGISVKLSALHPAYELANKDDVFARLIPRLKQIIDKAMKAGICITFDAEESARLDLSLEVFTKLINDLHAENFNGYHGLGLAVQAYHKQAFKVVEYIIELARSKNIRIPMRLVKGAYWDSEIKKAQVSGLAEYPVFTQKEYTDISYLNCAYLMLQNGDFIYPQFATHNALTIAEIEAVVGDTQFEFQLLHGMGKGVYDQVVAKYECRIYAPVGHHEELLAYLIRRLLENSANTSFVKKVADLNTPIDEILKDPLVAKNRSDKNIPMPSEIYDDRENSKGMDLGNNYQLEKTIKSLAKFDGQIWQARPIINGKEVKGEGRDAVSPFDSGKVIGKVLEPSYSEIKEALDITASAADEWAETSVETRAAILERMAVLLEHNKFELIALCVNEAGRTIEDSISEVREAIDFCNYYALHARKIMKNVNLQSPTGETNYFTMRGRGMFMCISPWNFPLAIFLGQIAAALVTGNTVIAKPAEQTPLIGAFTVKLLLEAGLPGNVIAFLPGGGEEIGKYVLSDKRTAGVAFTGSMETARIINIALAHRGGAIIPFIAETGGQNAMIVDSSALIEQTVDDIILSAFGSAGQRCSALRVLYVQDEIYDNLVKVLAGAMAELRLGNPADLQTNIGPLIDQKARDSIRKHIKQMLLKYNLIGRTENHKNVTENGNFVEPHAFEIGSINELAGEVFGPVLHVIRYQYKDLDKIIAEINDYGYGLTMGIQTRINSHAEHIKNHVKVGNIYVNRSMIGATVGVQPFGGEGLSGTGPKAGGPNYLLRFITEKVYTVNTAAAGGNRELLV